MLLPLRHPRLWLTIGWALVALAVLTSLLPSRQMPETHVNDKFEHFTAYAVMSLWFAGIYPRSRYTAIGLSLFAMGVGIEVAQGIMKMGRHAEFGDVVANSSGIAFALTAAWVGLGGWAQRVEAWIRTRRG